MIPRICATVAALLLLAGPAAAAGAKDPPKKEEGSTKVELKKEEGSTKVEPKKERGKAEPKADPGRKPERPVPGFPGGFDAERLKDLRKAMEEYRKAMDLAQQEMRRAMEDYRKAVEQVQRQFPKRPGARGPQGFPFGRFGGDGGRLGARVAPPGETLADQLNLPEGKGLVLEEVRADSPAAKGGLKAHDILTELNGKPVPSDPNEFRKLLDEIKPDAKVEAKVLRKGKEQTIKDLTLPEAKAPRPGFRPERPKAQPRRKAAGVEAAPPVTVRTVVVRTGTGCQARQPILALPRRR